MTKQACVKFQLPTTKRTLHGYHQLLLRQHNTKLLTRYIRVPRTHVEILARTGYRLAGSMQVYHREAGRRGDRSSLPAHVVVPTR